jgi:hypothetical protein
MSVLIDLFRRVLRLLTIPVVGGSSAKISPRLDASFVDCPPGIFLTPWQIRIFRGY